MALSNQIVEDVKKYYGEVLKDSTDLKTNACCIPSVESRNFTSDISALLKNVHPDIIKKSYGCGSPIPLKLKGKTVLDLGCGTGRDVYVLSQLVGPSGFVIGVDMTDNQLKVANDFKQHHMDKFFNKASNCCSKNAECTTNGVEGKKYNNVEFKLAMIEDMKDIVADNSVDVVVSNCVINLSSNKKAVFSEIYRILKPGGEFFFSDIFADRRVPTKLTEDPILLGECLSGALYYEDFRRLLHDAGFKDFRKTLETRLKLTDKDVLTKVGMIKFYSATIRTFKCDLEDAKEFYGHVARYIGGIESSEHEFHLDNKTVFKKNFPVLVDGNVAKILLESRFKDNFRVDGSFEEHMGLFTAS